MLVGSKSFLETFHKISIKYIDEEGFYDTKTLKTNNDDAFINLIYELKKVKYSEDAPKVISLVLYW